MERLGCKSTKTHIALLWLLFLPAAPFFAPGGGYLRISGFKYVLFLYLTVPWLLLSARETVERLRVRKLSPLQWAVLGLLAWSLVSALCSPWQVNALLGGGRHEGYVTLLLYGLGCLCVSVTWKPGRLDLLWPALGLGVLDCLCLLQLSGHNPLGLYPAGMGWRDANILYPGSYLGSVGNAGAAGAVLCTASALLFLALLRRGGKRWLLLIPLLPAGFILGQSHVEAAVLGLTVLLLLSPLAAVRRPRTLGRWLTAAPLMLICLFPRLWPWLCPLCPVGLVLLFLTREGERCSPLLRRMIAAVTLTGLALAPLLILHYAGGAAVLLEARAVLEGDLRDSLGSGRVYIWRQVLAALPRCPILGCGPDSLGLLELQPYVWYSPETGKTVISSIDAAHCEYLQTLICQGIPAALCHLALPVIALLRFLRRGDTPAGVCAGAALCYGIQACFGISACAAAPLFWLLLGCGEALAKPGKLC